MLIDTACQVETRLKQFRTPSANIFHCLLTGQINEPSWFKK